MWFAYLVVLIPSRAMAVEIIVPRLGWSMEEGAFVAWLKPDGAFVQAGDPLFSIEGDKAVQEIESMDSGILRIAPQAPAPGAAIRVGDVLGHLLTREEAAASLAGASAPSAPPIAPPVSVAPAPVAGSRPAIVAEPPSEPAAAQGLSLAGAVARGVPAISPRALRVATELGVEWTALTGSGRTGRIRERDVRAAAGRAGGRSAVPLKPSSRTVDRGEGGTSAVFFGELLMRLATRHHERFAQAREFEVRYTGAEANAAVSLACFGLEALVVSAVPDHELGQACLNYLRQYGVNVDHVRRGGARLGTYFLEAGSAPRASRVIYDRAGSAFAGLRPGALDWETILAGRQWLHWSGTAPALGPGLPAVVAEACAAARRLGVRVSCDLNYRALLWDADTARRTMVPLMRDVDVLLGNEEHIGLMLGVTAAGGVGELGAALRAKFGFQEVAITRRESASATPWRAWLVNASGTFASREYPVSAVDRIGAGDAFAAGLITALLEGWPGPEAIEFATAAGCFKHSVPGDFNLATREEVQAVMRGDRGERVRR